MVVFLSGTGPVNKKNPSVDGTLWLPLLRNHQQNNQAKCFSKYTLNPRIFSSREMQDTSSRTFVPARLYIVSGGIVSRTLTCSFLSYSLYFFHAPEDCNPCLTSFYVIPAALLAIFEPVKLVVILLSTHCV